jgi:hypothetical protein
MKKLYPIFFMAFVALFAWTSCGDSDPAPAPDDDNNQVVPQNARIGFFNGAEGIVKGSFSISTGIASQLVAGQASNMADVLEGTHTVVVKNGDNNAEVLNQSQAFKPKFTYDYFLAGTAAEPEVVKVEQSLTPTDLSKVYVQFVNLVKDTRNFKLQLQRKDVGGLPLQDIGAGMAFKAHTDYVALLPGTYATELTDAGGGSRPDQVTSNQKMLAGEVYQVVAYRAGSKILFTYKKGSRF